MKLAAIALGLTVAAGCSSSKSPGSGVPDAPNGVGSDAKPAGDGSPNAEVVDVAFTTSKGNFVIETHRSWAPNGVDRFRGLVNLEFYDAARFFRVITGFVVQFGINGTPATNAMWDSQTIPDDPVVQSNTVGYVSFAQTSAPNSRTTQLFINLGNNANLDAMGFAPIGIVTSGMDVVGKLDGEYGEAPDQTQITAQGNAYLTANFPNLDFIMTARIQ